MRSIGPLVNLVVVATMAAGVAVAASATVSAPRAAPPSKITRDVGALLNAENAVVGDLKGFGHAGSGASFASWEARTKAALAAQSGATAALSADLSTSSPPKPKPKPSSGVSSARFNDLNGNPYSVTPLGVVNPAQSANQFDEPASGSYFVAVVVRVTNIGKGQVSDDADSDASIIGSNDESYTFNPASVTECTNFDNGQFQLGPGQSVTGCVNFELPNGVKPAKFQWTAGVPSTFATWNID